LVKTDKPSRTGTTIVLEWKENHVRDATQRKSCRRTKYYTVAIIKTQFCTHGQIMLLQCSKTGWLQILISMWFLGVQKEWQILMFF